MAVLTNLASTLTARYFPSKTLTDAFYLDGRLFGKREARQADITIEKNERGYFLSVFAHPKLPNYEPGMMPPYEPELRGTCNEVKFGHKEIDEMIEGFLTTAVDVTGKSRINDADDRLPYFSGIIIRDSEAFAVTIGTGLAFLYRDDTLYPLTDAGIPMEPIDAKGNRVADFLYYCSSKTANALWSNFFTLAQDDCVILCNKEVYDALGQREILRILDEADDQCDAAGVIITQASARMPDVPMQFAISFVEDVVSDEKKGLFGFRKKAKEEDTSDMSIQSTFDGGLVGAAANAAAASGFAGSMTIDEYQPASQGSFVMFGDNKGSVTPPAYNQQASGNQGIVVDNASAPKSSEFVQFLDPSINKDVTEVSAEDVMKSLFADSVKSTAAAAGAAAAVAGGAAATAAGVAAANVAADTAAAGSTAASATSAAASAESIFVNEAVNPFASISSAPAPETMTPVSKTDFTIREDSDADKTKAVERLDASFMAQFMNDSASSATKSAPAPDTRTIEDAVKDIMGAGSASSDSENPFIVRPTVAAPETPVMSEPTPTPVVEAPVVEAPVVETTVVEAPAAIAPEAPVVVAPEAPVAESPFVAVAASASSPFVAASYAKEEPASEPVPVPEQPVEGTFVFSSENTDTAIPVVQTPDASSEFDPYSVGNNEEMQNAMPPVFGDDGVITPSANEEIDEASAGIPVPEFDIKSDKPEIEDSDKLGVEFPVSNDYDKPNDENKENVQPESGNDFDLPFENGAQTVNDIPEPVPEQIPEMPVYGANDYQAPTAAVNADVPVDNQDQGVYSYGQMVNNENMAEGPVEEPLDQSGYESLSPTAYGPYDEQPYTEGQYGYTPGQYQEGYDEASAGEPVAPSADDDWINSILGIDDSAFDMAGTAAAAGVAADQGMAAGGAAMADNGGYGYGRQPVNPANPTMRRNSAPSASRPRTASSGSGNGNGGKRRVPHLNRNGYMFLAFVIICFVCLIILISAIIRSCGRETVEETNIPNDTAAVVETTPVETEPAVTTTQDPSYPIGRFQFSDYVGYRTWWDLFNTVYGIDDIANTSDPRIQIILDYNGLDASYTPGNGDSLLLPPMGVLDGTIPVTFRVGGASTSDSSSTVSGEVQTVDGAAEVPAEGGAEAGAGEVPAA
ncbi:MAG: hypothetical protein IJ757_09080 [Clostridiales bacterium]|nr:hypothetical protein [Clostridiales bacterium]